jgi:hypothetical protein
MEVTLSLPVLFDAWTEGEERVTLCLWRTYFLL